MNPELTGNPPERVTDTINKEHFNCHATDIWAAGVLMLDMVTNGYLKYAVYT